MDQEDGSWSSSGTAAFGWSWSALGYSCVEPVSAVTNRVSSHKIRILKFASWRLAAQINGLGPDERRFSAAETARNIASGGKVGLFPASQKLPLETGLFGWAERIRTRRCRFSNRSPPSKCGKWYSRNGNQYPATVPRCRSRAVNKLPTSEAHSCGYVFGPKRRQVVGANLHLRLSCSLAGRPTT
jgi:hypothetical protein